MATLFGKHYTKAQLMKKAGNIDQLGGVKRMQFCDGTSKGVECAVFDTGAGLTFTAAIDRALDITSARFNGMSLCYRTPIGDKSPYFYDPAGLEWLYSFPAGMFSTCGLMNVGVPNEFDGDVKGQHGRVSNIPASNVHVDGYWDGDDYIMFAKGKIRETAFFGVNTVIDRTVSAKLGENKVRVEDVITNEANRPMPLMVLYHMNTGFPLLDKNSYICFASEKAVPRDEEAEKGKDIYNVMQEPENGYAEQVFYHDMKSLPDGTTCAALINPDLQLGYYVKYNTNELGYMTQWKCMDEAQYVVGIEPANCHVYGMAWEAENGTLEYLDSFESKHIAFEIGVLSGKEEIDEYKACVEKIMKS
ncbi:MAG: aldose 1-epimerase family protein [Abditibacteriota bacterium]|nr:aldose 1-epimerase family protein [Abditibacteriota bacterium]